MPSRLLVMLAFAVSATWGCAPQASLARIRTAYDEGRYQDAEPALRRLASSRSPEAPEARRLLDELVSRKRAVAAVLLARARSLRESPDGSLARALEYYDLAVAFLDGDASRKSVADERRKVEAIRQHRRRSYLARLETLAASTNECRPADQTRALVELAVVRRELEGGGSLSELATAAAHACFTAGRDVETVALTELALELSRPGERVEEAAMTRMALAAARLAAAEEREGSRRPGRGGSVEGREQASPSLAARADDDVLPRARALYAAGEVYRALLLLDEAIAGVATDEGLRSQRQAWQRERSELIAVYLERAEAALTAEDPDTAQIWYARVLALEPTHEIALDRMHKIENLRRLRSTRAAP